MHFLLRVKADRCFCLWDSSQFSVFDLTLNDVGFGCAGISAWQLRVSRLRLLISCSVPCTAQALRPVAGRLVDIPAHFGAVSSGESTHRESQHDHHHMAGVDGDDASRPDETADDDEADFTDTDALLEYLLRDRCELPTSRAWH